MKLCNPYTRGCIEYPLNFDSEAYNYHIEHETVFCPYHTAWAVTLLESGDKIYIPCGENRSRNIYVVTKFYTDGTVQFPRGIYTIPMSHWTGSGFINNNTIVVDDDDEDDDWFDDDFDEDDNDDSFFNDDNYFDDDDEEYFEYDNFKFDIDIDKLF